MTPAQPRIYINPGTEYWTTWFLLPTTSYERRACAQYTACMQHTFHLDLLSVSKLRWSAKMMVLFRYSDHQNTSAHINGRYIYFKPPYKVLTWWISLSCCTLMKQVNPRQSVSAFPISMHMAFFCFITVWLWYDYLTLNKYYFMNCIKCIYHKPAISKSSRVWIFWIGGRMSHYRVVSWRSTVNLLTLIPIFFLRVFTCRLQGGIRAKVRDFKQLEMVGLC